MRSASQLIPTVSATVIVTVIAILTRCKSDSASNQALLKVEQPTDGSTLNCSNLLVRGTSRPNAEVRRNIKFGSDDKIIADASGRWEYKTTFDEGDHSLEFFLQENKDTSVKLKINCVSADEVSPAAAANKASPADRAKLSIDDPPAGAVVGCPRVTVQGTASPKAEIHRSVNGKDPKFNADDAGHWEYTADLDEGENTLQFFLQGSQDVRAELKVNYDKATLQPSLDVISPAQDAQLYQTHFTIQGHGPAGCEVRREVDPGADQGAVVKGDGTWSMDADLDEGGQEMRFFLQESEATKVVLKVEIDTKLAPEPIVFRTASGREVTLGNQRQKDILEFYYNIRPSIFASDQDLDAWRNDQKNAENGTISSVEYYLDLKNLAADHHSAADNIWNIPAPRGLQEAEDNFRFSIKNRGDAMDHFANLLNTGDYEELRSGQQDLTEADGALAAAIAQLMLESEKAGLPGETLINMVTCERHEETHTYLCTLAPQ